ncbi:MAG: hypothetical protein ABEJ24_01000 [Candidatus Magasanikbacteria bacterium]
MKSNRGQSLLEVIIALGIFFSAIVGSLSATSFYLDNYQRSKDISKAREVVQESFAAIRSIAYEDWGQISDGTYGITTSSGKWKLANDPDTVDGKYKRKVVISSVNKGGNCNITSSGGTKDSDRKFVTTTVSWSTPSGTSTRSFGRYITRWGNPKNCLPKSDNGIAFTQNEELKTLPANDGQINEWDPGDVDIIGSMRSDFDDDGSNDLVYLKNKNKINVIDENDGSARDISISSQKAKQKNAILVSDNWNGSGTSTFYTSQVNPQNEIYHVDEAANPTLVADPDNGVDSVVGKGDIDGDGTDEFVFLDESQNLRYIEPADSDSQAYTKIYNDVGKKDSIGIGEPADFDEDGTDRVPIVDSGNDIILVDSGGKEETIIFSSNSNEPSKSPMASVDVDGDGLFEIVYIDKSGNNDIAKYINDVGGDNDVDKLVDENNNSIEADTSSGLTAADTNNE